MIDAYLGAHHDTDLGEEEVSATRRWSEIAEEVAAEEAEREAEAEAAPTEPDAGAEEKRRTPSSHRRTETRDPQQSRRRGEGHRRRLHPRREHPQRLQPGRLPRRDDRHHRSQRGRQVDPAQGDVRPGEGATRDSVTLHGEEITNLKANKLVEMGVGFVPQTNNVFPTLSIEENLRMGLFMRPKKLDERLAATWDLFPVLHDRRNQRAGALSGGERQSLAMARALMMEPSVLLLDEPSAGLSPVRQDETFLRTRRINKTGVCVVMVEQNARRCLQICDRGYVLDQGRDAYTGTGRSWPRTPRSSSSTSARSPRTSRPSARTASRTPDPANRAEPTRSGPGPCGPGPLRCRAGERTQLAGAPSTTLVELGNVVTVVLVDPDERRGRVVLLVDRTDTRRTGVADLLAILEERHAVFVRRALLAVGGAGDGCVVLLDGRRLVSSRP